MARFLVGIDLGTTNSALAYVDRQARGGARPKLNTFPVTQLVNVAETQALPLLPSFLYVPGEHDLPAGALALPWDAKAGVAVGAFARTQGAKVPGRLVSSAKSWLCHPGVDRTAPLLPWGAPPDATRVSPLEASTAYLTHFVQAWNHAPGRKAEDRLEDCPVTLTVPASFDDSARELTARAAADAGLKHVTLLEEPQAAFYAWLGTHSPQEAQRLKPGMRCLVLDVGGGTTDLSLIRVGEEQGELTFLRDAVGDHLLLGGDNMDLALAKTVEARLNKGKLDAAQFGSLVQACRGAKEAMLSADPPDDYRVTVVGRGRSVVGGTLSAVVTPEDVRETLIEGFFPFVPYDDTDADPDTHARPGLQEMGLPYVADAAVTRHLAAFLRQHLPAGELVDAVLFNGGVFTPEGLRERVIEVMGVWFSKPGEHFKPLALTSPSLDLAVAWGAAYAGWLRHSGGRRIGGGVPRSYYLGVEAKDVAPGQLAVVCVVPRQLAEGTEIAIPSPVFELAIGEPVLFSLYTSTARDDRPGEVVNVDKSQLLQLAPLHTMLRGGKRAGARRVPVTLVARNTEIGTLELFCVSQEGTRWKLEFNTREALPASSAEGPLTPEIVRDVYPEEKLTAAGQAIRDCYAGQPPAPTALPKALEAALEASRSDWPTGLCRRVWDDLTAAAPERTRSPAHLSRWYNLVGFCLRPGHGDPLDRYRIDALWKLIASASAAKPGAAGEGGADYWIMWRRVAGGLNGALQQSLFARLKPTLMPAKGKPAVRVAPNELTEMWRAAASFERIDPRLKQQLGEELLRQRAAMPVTPAYVYWSLTRFGARRQLNGPLNAVVHPDIAERWLGLLLGTPPADADVPNWAFCVAQLARRTGLRGVDVPDEVRRAAADALLPLDVPAEWPGMVAEVVEQTGAERSRLFGEALPSGLRLTD